MQKVVLKVDVNDDKLRQKVMRAVSALLGIQSISVNIKEKELTVMGNIDPVKLAMTLRTRSFSTEILMVRLAEEPKPPKETIEDKSIYNTNMN